MPHHDMCPIHCPRCLSQSLRAKKRPYKALDINIETPFAKRSKEAERRLNEDLAVVDDAEETAEPEPAQEEVKEEKKEKPQVKAEPKEKEVCVCGKRGGVSVCSDLYCHS